MKTSTTAGPTENVGAAAAQPLAENTRREFVATHPTVGDGFLSFEQLLPKLPVGERSARGWTRSGILPSIKLPGSRRVLYHWPSVVRALLRLQRGGGDL